MPEPPSTEAISPSPAIHLRSRRAIWAEVAAVLAVGVIPSIASSMTYLLSHLLTDRRSEPHLYWLDGLTLTATSLCVAYVVLYLIARSGEPFERFGFGVPHLFALLCAPPMLIVLDVHMTRFVYAVVPPDADLSHPFTGPDRFWDYVAMAIKHTANAFAEELVVRAYLITRLVELLKSRGEAVLISSALFAAYHSYYGAAGMISIFLLGLALGITFVCYRNVWVVTASHALLNMWIELHAG